MKPVQKWVDTWLRVSNGLIPERMQVKVPAQFLQLYDPCRRRDCMYILSVRVGKVGSDPHIPCGESHVS